MALANYVPRIPQEAAHIAGLRTRCLISWPDNSPLEGEEEEDGQEEEEEDRQEEEGEHKEAEEQGEAGPESPSGSVALEQEAEPWRR